MTCENIILIYVNCMQMFLPCYKDGKKEYKISMNRLLERPDLLKIYKCILLKHIFFCGIPFFIFHSLDSESSDSTAFH